MADKKGINSTEDTINVLITGDFCPVGRIEELCIDKEYDKIYNDVLDILKNKDLSITNLECPLTLTNNALNKSGPKISAHPECIKGIKYGGFDIATLANNHIMDYKKKGLNDTMDLCSREGILTVGAGNNNDKASESLYLNIKGLSLAIINCAENEFSGATGYKAGANILDDINTFTQIQEAKNKADIVLLIIHGGHENHFLPGPELLKRCRFFSKLGVSAIICHHSHCPGGYEIINNVPIFYSLGNFIFDSKTKNPGFWNEGFILRLQINKSGMKKFELIPYLQNYDQPGLTLMDEADKIKFIRKINEYSRIIGDKDLFDKKWKEYCDSQRFRYLSVLFNLNKIQRRMLNLKVLSGMLIRKKYLLKLLNVFRCDSHREAIIKMLESELEK